MQNGDIFCISTLILRKARNTLLEISRFKAIKILARRRYYLGCRNLRLARCIAKTGLNRTLRIYKDFILTADISHV